jgi:hypothetical protein
METSERHTAERINDLRADVSARLEAMRGMMEAELGSIRSEMDAFRNEVRA